MRDQPSCSALSPSSYTTSKMLRASRTEDLRETVQYPEIGFALSFTVSGPEYSKPKPNPEPKPMLKPKCKPKPEKIQ